MFFPRLMLATLCFAWVTAQPLLAADALLARAQAEFSPLTAPGQTALETPLATLGRALFWDARLSADARTACVSCHQPADWGADHRRFSPDARGKTTARNSQTVFNALLQPSLRWTGDRRSGAHQAERSLTGSMGFAAATDVIPLLQKHGYEPAFRRAFPADPSPVSPANYAAALAAYQATLITPAPFDRYLAGDTAALSARQRTGLRLFMDTGCADCHSGTLLGGTSLKQFGLKKDYWLATGSEKPDTGLHETTKDEADRYKFRVSPLRNIARTGPYFHDGSVSDLPKAVQIMAEVQLGNRLSEEDAAAITDFLGTLTGNIPAHYAPPGQAP